MKPKRPELDLLPDAEQLPAHMEKHGSRVAAAVMFGVAGLAACLAVAMFVAIPIGEAVPRVLLAIGPAIGAAAFLLGGLHTQRSYKGWTFTPEQVEYRSRSLFGPKEWAEPLSAFTGVLARQEYHSGGQNSPSYTLYLLSLQHRTDKRRSVKLYRSRAQEGFRAQHERYALLFGVSALLETEDGIEERRPEDLGKSLRERVAEGSLQVDFDPALGPPSARLLLQIEGDTLSICTRGNLLGIPGTLIPVGVLILSVAAAAVALILGLPGIRPLIPVGAIFGVLSIIAMVVLRGLREELLVSPREVRSRWHLPWGPTGGTSVPADEVEEVVVRRTAGKHGSRTVQAITDAKTVRFGPLLTQAEREWVRDCIIAVISR
ncbi:MAG: hypothetical protein ACYS8L_02925 [Planctomycetota bacterium]|jgi:hypothetical protein